MGNLVVTMDAKHPDKFLVLTKKDVSIFGWHTKSKFESYYMDISPWNLADLFKNKGKCGLEIDYDPLILPIVERLREEIKIYKDASNYKTLPADVINDMWEEAGFPVLFPKVEAKIYQKRTVLWALKVKKGGCYLEQGTGKTPVGIFILGKLLFDKEIEKPLVLAPLSLLSKTAWFKDLERFTEFKPINLRIDDELTSKGHINFINYDKLQSWCYHETDKTERSYNPHNYFEMKKFDAIFYDEASSLKGHDSYRTKAFLKISKHAKYIILASGTPAPNQIFQIWGQMKSLGSVLGDSYKTMEQRYGVQRSVGPTMRFFPTPEGQVEIRQRIDLVSYFIKRSDVLDLPTRHYVTEDVDLHPEHKKLYDKVEKDFIAAIHGFDENGLNIEGKLRIEHEVAMRIRLLQIINGFTTIEDKDGNKQRVTLPWNCKLDKLDELINKILADPTNNIIIWCRFRWEVETIYEKYKEISSYIYGGLTDKKREVLLDFWLNNEKCRIMIAVPSAAKFGHTWLKANYTIYFSGTEDFEDYAQSRDRNYRYGQTREVTEIKIITNKTIERKVWYAISTKKKMDKFLKDYYKNASF